MTSPGQSPVPFQTSQILTTEEYAVLGAKFQQAGLDPLAIRQFLAMVETEATKAALAAGKQVAMSIADTFLNTIQNVHDQTADRILQRISARNGGRMMTAVHRDCLNVIMMERYGTVRPTIVLPQQ